MTVRAAVAFAAVLLVGCAGAQPLLHTAQALPPGKVTIGAGVAGRLTTLETTPETDNTPPAVVEDFALAPGIAPWAAGRVGIVGDNEAGLLYSGRTLRADFRHAFKIDPIYLSIGLGGSALLPRGRLGDSDLGSVAGGGADLPVLFGWTSDAELYSVWFGPRAGFEIFSGNILESELTLTGRDDTYVPFSGKQIYVGGLIGAKIGFRMIHAALELDIDYHFADGTFGEDEETFGVEQLSVTPAGAIILTF